MMSNKVSSQNIKKTDLLKTDSIYSQSLKEYRKYFIYIPKELTGKTDYDIIFATDGQEIQEKYPQILDSLITSKTVAATVLIGVYSNETPNGHNSTFRHVEYVNNDNKRYEDHMEFFLNELPSAIFNKYNLNAKKINKKIFYGFSNGAAFGIDVYLKKKKNFDDYICFSPLGTKIKNIQISQPAPTANLFIEYGSEEIFIAIDEYKNLISKLKQNKINVKDTVYKGGHDRKIWINLFFELLTKLSQSKN